MAMATSQEQLRHISNAVMHAIHDVFPADSDDENDPISLKKLRKKEGEWALLKEMLGFDFDGLKKTISLLGRSSLCSSIQHSIVGEDDEPRSSPNGLEVKASQLTHVHMAVMCGAYGMCECDACFRKASNEPPMSLDNRDTVLIVMHEAL
jgi:hypothetical protein